MRTSCFIAASLAALVGAVPTSEPKPSENIDISDFIVRKDSSPSGTKINVVDFKLKGRDAENLSCTAQSPEFPAPKEVTTCGDSKYRFSLHAGNGGSEFSLRVYHELGLAVGYWGQGDVPTYCHAGGNGPNDYACVQVAPVTIVIDNTPPPVDP
ncbi:nuclear distribution protein nudE [Purpureocillium lavendulum]|uniref:Nuclear distribution protein nudE n=1 Tax=Purpureocillium lavendulum TaxID=1247861 RepID=A0AB34FZD1_9HYPO|nr:nuclear distribution protein nudE [Purpureocillium lavendulum]